MVVKLILMWSVLHRPSLCLWQRLTLIDVKQVATGSLESVRPMGVELLDAILDKVNFDVHII